MKHRIDMSPMEIIVAVDEHGGFGKNGAIPWIHEKFAKEDLKRFQELTKNNVCVMGRRTYDDMLRMVVDREGKKKKVKTGIKAYVDAGYVNPENHLPGTIKDILPQRESYVITSNPKHFVIGASIKSGLREVVNSLEESDARKIFILGGNRLFIEALVWTETVHMTVVKGNFHCDVHFPMNYLNTKFNIHKAEKHKDLDFITFRRTDWR